MIGPGLTNLCPPLMLVVRGIRHLEGVTAVAFDLISNDMIKAVEDVIAPILTMLFHRILKNEYPLMYGA